MQAKEMYCYFVAAKQFFTAALLTAKNRNSPGGILGSFHQKPTIKRLVYRGFRQHNPTTGQYIQRIIFIHSSYKNFVSRFNPLR